jgi:hypothetical protein
MDAHCASARTDRPIELRSGVREPSTIGRAGNTGQLANVPERAQADPALHHLASFQVAESMGFKGDFRQWEHLLRIGE